MNFAIHSPKRRAGCPTPYLIINIFQKNGENRLGRECLSDDAPARKG